MLDTSTKTGQDALRTSSKKVVHRAPEATEKFKGSNIADKILKSKLVSDENSRDIEEIVIPPEKREGILNELRQVF